ncbi:MAG: hypothetical protein COB02_04115 [Candidatus Cloacimonadota bacterium]|nr:MAG: hypothetical protein COB02_04115 [Candidatus Cloacimonadota bacterium]
MLFRFFLILCFSHQIYSQEVTTLLSGYEWKLKPKLFLNRNEDTAQKLMDIAINKQLKYHIRVRAIIALKLFSEERVIRFLEEQINNNLKSSNLTRHLLSLEQITKQQKERYIKSAKKHLFHKQGQIRLNIARSLKRVNTRSSRSLLKVQASKESDPRIKKLIQNKRAY